VLLVHPGDAHLGERPDPGRLVARREPDPATHQPLDAPVAAGSAEHEVDRREQALLSEDLDHLLPPRDVDAAMALARSRDALVLRRARTPPVVRLVPDLLAIERDDVGVGCGVAVLLDVHRMQVATDQVVVLERHGALLLDHHARYAAERADPFAEL